MENETGRFVSIRFDHAKNVYERMKETAEEVGDDLVWEGFLTRLVKDDLGLATPMYSDVRNSLKDMGCIHQIRRGGSSTPSRWQLLKEPTEELWHKMPKRKGDSRIEIVEQQLRDFGDRLRKIEDALTKGISA